MVLNLGQDELENLFPHAKDFDQGLGTRGIRVGFGEIIVALDGSGDYDDIQEAIDSLGSVGGTILLKEGVYKPKLSIDLKKDNVTLRGVSWGATIDMSDIPGLYPKGIYTSNKDNLLIENIQIVGNGLSILLINCNHSKVSYCYLKSGNDGVCIDNSDNVIVENNFIENSSGDFGINILSTSTFIIVKDNRLYGSNIVLEGGDKSIISNNLIDNWGGDGDIHLFSSANNNIVCNNIIYSAGSYAIWLEGTNNNNVIEGNRCSGAGAGVEIENASSKTLVTSNNCVGCTNAVVDNGVSTTAVNNTN